MVHNVLYSSYSLRVKLYAVYFGLALKSSLDLSETVLVKTFVTKISHLVLLSVGRYVMFHLIIKDSLIGRETNLYLLYKFTVKNNLCGVTVPLWYYV